MYKLKMRSDEIKSADEQMDLVNEGSEWCGGVNDCQNHLCWAKNFLKWSLSMSILDSLDSIEMFCDCVITDVKIYHCMTAIEDEPLPHAKGAKKKKVVGIA